jgi:hypothetical protein
MLFEEISKMFDDFPINTPLTPDYDSMLSFAVLVVKFDDPKIDGRP